MATFEDLSDYTYAEGAGRMLNVGWLGRGSNFPTGSPPAGVREALVRKAEHPVNVMRGFHYCEFCDEESPIMVPSDEVSSGRVFLGTGEIHVVAEDTTYAAPTLIIHYIDAHSYLPPEQFCLAVLADDTQASE